MKSQNKQILAYLKRGKSLTAIQALDKFECFRLAARINDLKHEGHNIKSIMVSKDGKRFAKYLLSTQEGE